MRILNFGSCNIDYVYRVDHIVLPGETLSADSLERFPGGKGLNQSVAAARAGAQICHAGVLGNDGQMLRQVLGDSGVDLTYIREENCPNGHAIIQVSANAQNSIFLFEGTNGMVTREYVDQVLDRFSPGDILLLQNEVSNVPYLVRQGHKKGMTIVFNPAPFNDRARQVDMEQVDYLIVNEVEAGDLFGTRDVDQILQRRRERYPRMKLVLTLGVQGCVYADEGTELVCPAFRVEAVDTTAAGDTFAGYFVAGLAAGETIPDVLRTASAASALAVSGMGAAPSIPEMNRVREALRILHPYEELTANKKRRLNEHILDYINQDPAGADLGVLAGILGYSQSYTGVLVKEVTGEKFCDLVQSVRCGMAAKLLRETELPVSEVIQKAGYQNESFFRRIFRQTYGKTPLQYRKQQTGGEKK